MHMLDEFDDSVSDADNVIPERTRLYNLQPEKTLEGLNEGLISYLVRLAREHCVRPRDLIRLVLADGKPEISCLCYNSFYAEYANTVNGLGKYAALFASRLNELTGRNDLDELTMLSWRDLIPEQSENFIARHRRWCPACLAAGGNDAFAPMVWSLEQYRCCTVHAVDMVECCPHCQRQQSFIPSMPALSLCDYCGKSLASICTKKSKVDVSVEQLIIQLMRYPARLKGRDLKAEFKTYLCQQIDQAFAGNRAAFCRSMGWNAWAVKGWINDGQRISFPKLLKLYSSHVHSVTQFQRQAASAGENDASQRARRPLLESTAKIQIRKILDAELGVSAPRPLDGISKELGLTRSALRYWFPEECSRLTELRRKQRNIEAAEAHLVLESAVSNAIYELKQAGLTISRRAVEAKIKNTGLVMARPEVREVYRRHVYPEHAAMRSQKVDAG